jgi:chitin disaccharide deacetylase
MNSRYLIVNADDFGLSKGVNKGIIHAHEHGILTSTSLMVRWPGAVAAADYARSHPKFSVGLHLDLAEWVCRNYEWFPLYQVVSTDDPVAVREEVRRQLDTFQKLVGKNPTHIDSHQHCHRNEPVLTILKEVASECGVPLRSFCPDVAYCGDFYGQSGDGTPYPEGITVECYLKILENLPQGFTEAACHPSDDPTLDSVYRDERLQELKVLCDPVICAAVERLGVKLCSFIDYARIKKGL